MCAVCEYFRSVRWSYVFSFLELPLVLVLCSLSLSLSLSLFWGALLAVLRQLGSRASFLVQSSSLGPLLLRYATHTDQNETAAMCAFNAVGTFVLFDCFTLIQSDEITALPTGEEIAAVGDISVDSAITALYVWGEPTALSAVARVMERWRARESEDCVTACRSEGASCGEREEQRARAHDTD